MTKMRTYECPSCVGRFEYLHHPNVQADPPPRFCPLCGFDTLADEALALTVPITSPHIQNSAVVKGVDGAWQAEQEGAKFRAELSGESSLSITDMKDNLRAGDITAIPVNNTVTQAMEQTPGQFGWQREQGLAVSQLAHSFPDPRLGKVIMPNAGARAMNAVRSAHAAAGGTITDTPALETQQPGYRRRA
jgi:hypothetical protein